MELKCLKMILKQRSHFMDKMFGRQTVIELNHSGEANFEFSLLIFEHLMLVLMPSFFFSPNCQRVLDLLPGWRQTMERFHKEAL